MSLELYIGRSPAGTSFFYAGRVYELPRGQSIRAVRHTINGTTWTAVLTGARKITLEQNLVILQTEPNIPNTFALSNHGYAPLPKRDFDFLVTKAAKLAQKKALALKRDDLLRKQHANDSWHTQKPIVDSDKTTG